MFENPTSSQIKALYNYIDYCCILNLHLGGFNGHVTFSVTLPQQVLTELKKEKLEQYLCPLILFNLKKIVCQLL